MTLWHLSSLVKRDPNFPQEISSRARKISDINSDGGGFFLTYEDMGRMFDHPFPARAYFFKVEISLRTLIPLFRPGSVHSCSAS